jgi:transcription elongation factor Elf1
MSIYTDIEYIEKLQYQLLLFKKKGRNQFNFRCPVCGDSHKSKTKARGYIYEKHGKINFRCHNCGASMSASNFIKFVNPELHKEYIAESFEDSVKNTRNPKFARSLFAGKKKPRLRLMLMIFSIILNQFQLLMKVTQPIFI